MEIQDEVEYSCFYCKVDLKTYSKVALVFDWIFMVVMVGLGVFIMINGIMTVVKPSSA